MATNRQTLESLEKCRDVLNEVLNIQRNNLPLNILEAIDEAESDGSVMRGHKNTLSSHIGQQKRQIAWEKEENGKWKHKNKSVSVLGGK